MLVVLSHLWVIVPTSTLHRLGPLEGLTRSGNYGVSMFFVMGGFLVTSRLIDVSDTHGTVPVDRFWARRIVRLGSQLYLMLAVLWVVSRFDRWDAYSPEQTRRSLFAIATFTFNWTLVNTPQLAREDLGHLWYISVEQQFYLVWVALLAWLAGARRLLMVALTVAAIASMAWRWHVLHESGWWRASLQTTTRIDALCLGALVALIVPRMAGRTGAPWILTSCSLVVSAMILATPWSDEFGYLQGQGIVLVVAVAAMVGSIAAAPSRPSVVGGFLGARALRALGAVSWPLFLWHLPVFYAADRWARSMSWQPRACLALVAVAAITALAYVLIERPASRWIRTFGLARNAALVGSNRRAVS